MVELEVVEQGLLGVVDLHRMTMSTWAGGQRCGEGRDRVLVSMSVSTKSTMKACHNISHGLMDNTRR